VYMSRKFFTIVKTLRCIHEYTSRIKS
jgi:hypothetical protein